MDEGDGRFWFLVGLFTSARIDSAISASRQTQCHDGSLGGLYACRHGLGSAFGAFVDTGMGLAELVVVVCRAFCVDGLGLVGRGSCGLASSCFGTGRAFKCQFRSSIQLGATYSRNIARARPLAGVFDFCHVLWPMVGCGWFFAFYLRASWFEWCFVRCFDRTGSRREHGGQCGLRTAVAKRCSGRRVVVLWVFGDGIGRCAGLWGMDI